MNIDNKNSQTQESCLTDVKFRFFAQYWEPNIFVNEFNNKLDNSFIKLKRLSTYTDDDAIAVEKIWRKSDSRIEAYFKNEYEKEKNGDYKIVGRNLIKYWLEKEDMNFQNRIDPRTIQHITDFLRSKRYAVPYMEYSVEDLVSFGWVRLV